MPHVSWSDADVAELMAARQGSPPVPWDELAIRFNRTENAVYARYRKGVVGPRKPRKKPPYARRYSVPAWRENDDAKHLRLVFEASGGLGFPFGVLRKAAA